MAEEIMGLGPVRRWKDGRILWAENDIVREAYVATSDERKVGTSGWYGNPGTHQIWVEFIGPERAALWNGANGQYPNRAATK